METEWDQAKLEKRWGDITVAGFFGGTDASTESEWLEIPGICMDFWYQWYSDDSASQWCPFQFVLNIATMQWHTYVAIGQVAVGISEWISRFRCKSTMAEGFISFHALRLSSMTQVEHASQGEAVLPQCCKKLRVPRETLVRKHKLPHLFRGGFKSVSFLA